MEIGRRSEATRALACVPGRAWTMTTRRAKTDGGPGTWVGDIDVSELGDPGVPWFCELSTGFWTRMSFFAPRRSQMTGWGRIFPRQVCDSSFAGVIVRLLVAHGPRVATGSKPVECKLPTRDSTPRQGIRKLSSDNHEPD